MHTWTAPNGVVITSEVPRKVAWQDRWIISHLAWSWTFTAKRVIKDWRKS